MKKLPYLSLRVFALILFFGGIILAIYCSYSAWDFKIHHYHRDSVGEFLWNAGTVASIAVSLSSIVVCGLSYVVEAACKYIERVDEEEE